MESVALKNCTKPGCDALASPSAESTEGSFCVRHAKYRCTDEGCSKETKYGDANGGKPRRSVCCTPSRSTEPQQSAPAHACSRVARTSQCSTCTVAGGKRCSAISTPRSGLRRLP
ncbi:unnamed protein product [Laminaria digitata]